VCCSVMQCDAVCCSVLQCVAVCCSVLQCVAVGGSVLQRVAVCCRVLQCVAVCGSGWQCVAVCCSVLQSVAVCCSVLEEVFVCEYGFLQTVGLSMEERKKEKSNCECLGGSCIYEKRNKTVVYTKEDVNKRALSKMEHWGGAYIRRSRGKKELHVQKKT